jgi:hypothetical protein
MKKWIVISVCSAMVVLLRGERVWAEQMLFPADFGHVSVKAYGAVGDGKTDDTQAIQRCIDENHNDNIIYLPKGTYLVSTTIKWAEGQKRTLLWGEDREQTIIRLKDDAPAFAAFLPNTKGELVKPVPLIWTGNAPAQRFRNGLRNLTINTGRANPAVSALQYNTSNQGSIWYVTIISEDGGGHAGLDISYTGEIGPGLVYDMKIIGFAIGVKSWVYNSMTLMKLQLHNQKEVGIKHAGGVLTIWGLSSTNTVPAIVSDAVLTLIDARCSNGAADKDAITINKGSLYARNLEVSGYKSAIVNRQGTAQGALGPSVKEFHSHAAKGLFGAGDSSLNIPLNYPPQLPWENDMSKWANPLDYGAAGDGKVDDTRALQAAIDDPSKSTLYFPQGKQFKVSALIMRGSINRFVSFGWNRISKGGVIEVVDGAAPVVQIDNYNGLYYDITIKINTRRTVLVTSSSHAHVTDVRGSGTVYLLDNVANTNGFTMHLQSPEQMVYAVQHNSEGNGAAQTHRNIVNQGANLVLIGLKTENWCTKIHTQDQGFTELLGGWIMGNGSEVKSEPMFSVDNANFSAVNILSYSLTNPPSPFLNWVEERRGSETRVLKNADIGGSTLVLYTGYTKAFSLPTAALTPRNHHAPSGAAAQILRTVRLGSPQSTGALPGGQSFLISGRRLRDAAQGAQFGRLAAQLIIEKKYSGR